MITRSTGAVSDTVTNVSPTRSPGLMALSAARRWSLGKTTTRGSLTRTRYANSGTPFSRPKKSCIHVSLQKGLRELRRVLTRYHHVDVRQFVVQDPQGFGHPCEFVSGQKAHGEAWLGGMSHPACSFGCRFN